VLPPALVAGYQYPLLIALLGRGREHVGRTWLGRRLEHRGCFRRALAGGFGLLPLLTAPAGWRAAALLLAALACWPPPSSAL